MVLMVWRFSSCDGWTADVLFFLGFDKGVDDGQFEFKNLAFCWTARSILPI